ncbi:MAG: type II toxin-antitoxin system Phd/YefM family antitoxin [Candidatus Azambacteria bacterium]|nr:type II toxin-antitoxin system Phd/YefM family antitoxin [Candidatus Azambacteria bacterium]
MNTQTTLSISEARKKIFQIAQKVQKPYIHYTLTEKGRPYVVIMSADEFESWQETLEVIQEFPDLKKDAEQARHAVATKAYKKYKTLEEITGGKKATTIQKRTHGISHTLRAKGGKGPR